MTLDTSHACLEKINRGPRRRSRLFEGIGQRAD
jgi:hypothetical protein